jgi:hypothetical protein
VQHPDGEISPQTKHAAKLAVDKEVRENIAAGMPSYSASSPLVTTPRRVKAKPPVSPVVVGPKQQMVKESRKNYFSTFHSPTLEAAVPLVTGTDDLQSPRSQHSSASRKGGKPRLTMLNEEEIQLWMWNGSDVSRIWSSMAASALGGKPVIHK